MGSGRLPTHIFLLDSLSLLRNQVTPYLDIHCSFILSYKSISQTSKEPSSRSEKESIQEQALALQANLSALASRGSVSARYLNHTEITCALLNLLVPC